MNPTRVVGTFPARNLVGQAGKGKGPAILSSRALWRRLAHRFFDLHQRQQSYSCAYSKLALYPTTSLDPRASKADGLTGSGSSAFSWMFTLTVAKFNSKSKPRSDLREQFYLAAVAQKPETTDAVPQYESASSDGNRVRNRLPQENANRKKLPLRENTSSNRVFQHQLPISLITYSQNHLPVSNLCNGLTLKLNLWWSRRTFFNPIKSAIWNTPLGIHAV